MEREFLNILWLFPNPRRQHPHRRKSLSQKAAYIPWATKLVQSARFRASPFKVLFSFLPAVLRPIELRREQHALSGTLFSNRRRNAHHYYRKCFTNTFSYPNTLNRYFLWLHEWQLSRTPTCHPVRNWSIDRYSTMFHKRLWPTSADVGWRYTRRQFADDWLATRGLAKARPDILTYSYSYIQRGFSVHARYPSYVIDINVIHLFFNCSIYY